MKQSSGTLHSGESNATAMIVSTYLHERKTYSSSSLSCQKYKNIPPRMKATSIVNELWFTVSPEISSVMMISVHSGNLSGKRRTNEVAVDSGIVIPLALQVKSLAGKDDVRFTVND